MEVQAQQQQYCLKWNNHPRNIATVFDRLRTEELFVDVSLATSDRQVIRAHRVLVSAGSGYLAKVLAMNPSDHPTVVLSNIRYKELKLLVDFMYTGEIAVDQQQLPGLLEAAKWLRIKGLYEGSMDDDDEDEEDDSMTVTTNTVKIPAESLISQKLQENNKRKRSQPSEDKSPSTSPTPVISSTVSVLDEAPSQTNETTPPPPKLYRPMYGVSNAYFLTNPPKSQPDDLEDTLDDKEKQLPDIPSLLNPQNPSKPPTPADLLHHITSTPNKSLLSPQSISEHMNKGLLSPQSISEHMSKGLMSPQSITEHMLAMQLSNPYLNPMMPLNVSMSPGNPNKPSLLSPTSANRQFCGMVASAPVRRYKQYSEDSLQAALKEIMEGQSINRSSMKHNIPARTLRDWMKRLNIKSVFTHHSHNKDRSPSQDGTEESSMGSLSPEPDQPINLVSGSGGYGDAFPGMEAIMARFRETAAAAAKAEADQEEIDDDEEEHNLRIDEAPESVVQIAKIAQPAN